MLTKTATKCLLIILINQLETTIANNETADVSIPEPEVDAAPANDEPTTTVKAKEAEKPTQATQTTAQSKKETKCCLQPFYTYPFYYPVFSYAPFYYSPTFYVLG